MLALGGLAAGTAGSARADDARLSGLVALSDSLRDRWPLAGAFLYPLGDPHDFRRGLGSESGYAVLRGLSHGTDSTAAHRGADLGNGHPGGEVRAAAAGLVVCGAGDGWRRGYGNYVTIAHRLPNGRLVYTVYAHLTTGSLRVRRADRVWAGRVIGRVGRTGRATANHLHFEVRSAGEFGTRWENLDALDPLDFVASRLPAHRGERAGEAGSLEWAECSGLIGATEDASLPLQRTRWRALQAALCVPGRERSAGIEPSEDATAPPEWSEFLAYLTRLDAAHGWAAIGPSSPELARACLERFGSEQPTHEHARVHDPEAAPTLADACLAAAALCASAASAPRSEPNQPQGPREP